MSRTKEDDNKNNVLCSIEFGKLTKIMTDDPSYLLEVRKAEDKEKDFKIIKFKNAEELLSHTNVRKKLFRESNHIIVLRLSRGEWENKLDELLPNREEREAPEEAEIKELSNLRVLLMEYLTHRDVKKSKPSFIKPNEVYLANNVYYFFVYDLMDYLRLRRYSRGKHSLQKLLVSCGCSEGDIQYTRRDGTTGTMECWMMNNNDSLRKMALYYQDMLDR